VTVDEAAVVMVTVDGAAVVVVMVGGADGPVLHFEARGW